MLKKSVKDHSGKLAAVTAVLDQFSVETLIQRCVNSSRSRIIGRSWLLRKSLCVVKNVEGIEPRPRRAA